MRPLLLFILLVWSGTSLADEAASKPEAPPADSPPAAPTTDTTDSPAPTVAPPTAAPVKKPEAVKTKKLQLPAKEAKPKAAAKRVRRSKKKGSSGLLIFKKGRFKLKAHVLGTMRAETFDAVTVDALGSQRALDAVYDARGRVGLTLDYRKSKFQNLKLEYEHDLWTGPLTEADTGDVELVGATFADKGDHELRKASLKARNELLFAGGGFMLSHWGMGLISNDGAHGWRPGSARFVDPRGGDRVLRAFGGLGPFPGMGLILMGGYDFAIKDDVLLEGDEGHQAIVALFVDPRKANRGGVYAAFRTHEHGDGKKTEVTAVDAHLRLEKKLGNGFKVSAENESVFISGTTDLGPNPTFPKHDIRQFGSATRLSASGARSGLVLDFLYASGDQNFDDNQLNAFKADQNYDMGFVLFRYLMASASARTPVLASDPDLVGVPSENLDRLPTRGSASNTISLFPRAWWRPIAGLELYGGVLIALSAGKQANAFYTRLAGGVARNHNDAEPGNILGTEYDAGIRVFIKRKRFRTRIALEGAHFVPGDALITADGADGKGITAMRAIFEIQI